MRDFLKRLGAGGDSPEGEAAGASPRERGRMRRRLRRQQRVREALLLDLGALVYELHRQGRREPELLQAKATEVSGVDREVRALAEALGIEQAGKQLLAPGILGSCRSCGALLTTDASFCPSCGTPTEPALAAEHEPSDEVPAELDQAEETNGDRALPEEEQREMPTGETQSLPPWETQALPPWVTLGYDDDDVGQDAFEPGGWRGALRRGRDWLRGSRRHH